jgi:hypothetical protein
MPTSDSSVWGRAVARCRRLRVDAVGRASTVSAGFPTVSAGFPTVSAGRPTLSAGRPTLSAGPPSLSAGPPSLPAGRPALPAEHSALLARRPTFEGRASCTVGRDHTLRAGGLRLYAGRVAERQPAYPVLRLPGGSRRPEASGPAGMWSSPSKRKWAAFRQPTAFYAGVPLFVRSAGIHDSAKVTSVATNSRSCSRNSGTCSRHHSSP